MATVPMPGSGRDFGLVLRSDLRGVASELPAPLAKTPASQRRLHLELEFPETGVVSVAGDLDRELRWMLRLTANEQAWRIERGALRAGGDPALLPDVPGVELSGRLPRAVGQRMALTPGRRGCRQWRQCISGSQSVRGTAERVRSEFYASRRSSPRHRRTAGESTWTANAPRAGSICPSGPISNVQ